LGDKNVGCGVKAGICILALITVRFFGLQMPESRAKLAQGVLWIYVTFMVLFQRWMFFRWRVVKDLAQFKQVAPIMVLAGGLPGVAMIVCLLAIRSFFGW